MESHEEWLFETEYLDKQYSNSTVCPFIKNKGRIDHKENDQS